jgi:3',5'-cyclic AMP phosphodiesterase CpdA
MNKTKLTRRTFLKTTGAATGLTVSSGCLKTRQPIKRDSQNNKVLRFAHFTDIHLEPKNNAPEGFKKALTHLQSLPEKPQLLITGGDHVMDSFHAKEDWAKTQFELIRKILKENCKIPIKYCIGNHDVWGADKKNSLTTGKEPLWGKKRFLKIMDIPHRFYSFSVDNWQFIVLDSTFVENNAYTAKIDDEQFSWIENQLKLYRDKFIVIISHIPILSAAVFFDGSNEKKDYWSVPGQWMHIDARKLKNLFDKYPNVKLCLSGHLHLVDKVKYNKVTYICDGAICGAWWKGNNQECNEGYGVIDLYRDGSFVHNYHLYGWDV